MAKSSRTRWILVVAAASIILVGFAALFFPRSVPVDLATVTRGAIDETVSDYGETQVRDAYMTAAPVSGFLKRTPLKVGDGVIAGVTVVAEIVPADPSLLDPASRAEREAIVAAARAQRDQREPERVRTAAVLARTRTLARQGFVSQQALEDAEADALAAEKAVTMAEAELRAAEGSLIGPGARGHGEVVVRAPVSGLVTRILEPSERSVSAGTPLIEVSDHAALEAAIEFLSQDAVRIAEGMPAQIYDWGGPGSIAAVVRRVEPSAHTKVSALGVEEQRTWVRLQLMGPPEQWARLGVGYRVWGRVFLRRERAALKVPVGALVRAEGRWAVFRLESHRARRRFIDVGTISDREAEVRFGLSVGDSVIVFPSDEIGEGVRVRARG